jgi:hypothetical protein
MARRCFRFVHLPVALGVLMICSASSSLDKNSSDAEKAMRVQLNATRSPRLRLKSSDSVLNELYLRFVNVEFWSDPEYCPYSQEESAGTELYPAQSLDDALTTDLWIQTTKREGNDKIGPCFKDGLTAENMQESLMSNPIDVMPGDTLNFAIKSVDLRFNGGFQFKEKILCKGMRIAQGCRHFTFSSANDWWIGGPQCSPDTCSGPAYFPSPHDDDRRCIKCQCEGGAVKIAPRGKIGSANYYDVDFIASDAP